MTTTNGHIQTSRKDFDGIIQMITAQPLADYLADNFYDLDVMEKRAEEGKNTWEPHIPNSFMFAWCSLTLTERALVSSTARSLHWHMSQQDESKQVELEDQSACWLFDEVCDSDGERLLSEEQANDLARRFVAHMLNQDESDNDESE